MIEEKIMTKKRFSTAVEMMVLKQGLTYIEAMTELVEDRGLDYANIPRLLTDSLRDKIEAEANRYNLLRDAGGNTLPV
tara:strand:+ start:199 stop:432 length:234 start_codon:yes stop_codon:yes gene_type:complete